MCPGSKDQILTDLLTFYRGPEPVGTRIFIHNFGRTDQLDREQLVRLCRSIARVCNLTIVDPYSNEQNQKASKMSALPGGQAGRLGSLAGDRLPAIQ